MSSILLLLALFQDPPPSPVSYDPPVRSSHSATYECPARRVRFEYETTGWTSGGSPGVAIVRYRSGRTEMSRSNVAEWNSELARIQHFRFMELRCQTQDRALITALGNDERGREVRVVASVQGSTIRFIRSPSGY